MAKVVETIGSTYEEALKNGLEQIGLTEDEVNIEIVKDATQAKKSFFSILEPRQVKLIISEKVSAKQANNEAKKQAIKQYEEQKNVEKVIEELDDATISDATDKINSYLSKYFKAMELDLTQEVSYKDGYMFVTIKGDNTGLIIGHRGETLEALQVILSTVLNKDSDKRIRVIIDSENYREKRSNSLKGLALREADQVVRKKRNFTFEPMTAFERKAIHSALQNHPKVTTYSVGDEPYRKVVIALK